MGLGLKRQEKIRSSHNKYQQRREIKMTKYMYMLFLTPSGKGYGCFAIDKLATNKFKVAASFCSPHDRKKFSKKQARDMALGRLHKSGVEVELDTEEKKNILLQVVEEAIQTECFVPKWVVQSLCMNAFSVSLSYDCLSYEDLLAQFALSCDDEECDDCNPQMSSVDLCNFIHVMRNEKKNLVQDLVMW